MLTSLRAGGKPYLVVQSYWSQKQNLSIIIKENMEDKKEKIKKEMQNK